MFEHKYENRSIQLPRQSLQWNLENKGFISKYIDKITDDNVVTGVGGIKNVIKDFLKTTTKIISKSLFLYLTIQMNLLVIFKINLYIICK